MYYFAMVEVKFQTFSPFKDNLTFEDFLYELVENLENLSSISNISKILILLCDIVTFCKAYSTIVCYAIMQQLQHLIRKKKHL